jgi:hypothetical protein
MGVYEGAQQASSPAAHPWQLCRLALLVELIHLRAQQNFKVQASLNSAAICFEFLFAHQSHGSWY